jgi:hypothetical protein
VNREDEIMKEIKDIKHEIAGLTKIVNDITELLRIKFIGLSWSEIDDQICSKMARYERMIENDG